MVKVLTGPLLFARIKATTVGGVDAAGQEGAERHIRHHLPLDAVAKKRVELVLDLGVAAAVAIGLPGCCATAARSQ